MPREGERTRAEGTQVRCVTLFEPSHPLSVNESQLLRG